jgi:Fe-S-cluster containining protein
MPRKFSCVNGCSDCCIYRDYYPSIEYGKIGVLILPEEKSRIEEAAWKMGIEVKIIPRLGLGKNRKGNGPKKIIAYQMLGKNLDGNLCPFLGIESSQMSPHGGFKCRIYKQRPFACRAYPVIDNENSKSVILDNKCLFCKKFSMDADTGGLQREIEALTKIKAEVHADKKTEVWRYATAIGDNKDKPKFLPEGWVLQIT